MPADNHKPRTVLILTPSARLLGARRSLLQLATALDPDRWRPVVVAQSEGPLLEALRAAGIESRVYFMGWWRKGRYMLQRPWKVRGLAGIARETGAALIHCNEFYPTPYAVRAARRAGGLAVLSHMRLSITPRQIRNYDLARADGVVAVSRAAASDFAAAWSDWERRVEVVHNGVRMEEYRSALIRAEARGRLGLKPDDFVVGQFQLLGPRKRADRLVTAAGLLRERLPHLRILLVGSPGRSDGDYESGLRDRVAREGLDAIVRFLPFANEGLADLYRACDVNTILSDREGFGRTPIEAGVQGIPSIGTRVGGIPEVILDGQTGLLVNAEDDGHETAEAIATLAEDTSHLQALGDAARRRVESEFRIERHAERMMDLYDRVLTRKA